jgi:hypothetical protein
MLASSKLSRADADLLCEAGDIAEAQLRLVEQVKRGTGAFLPPLRTLAQPASLFQTILLLVASALVFGAWA